MPVILVVRRRAMTDASREQTTAAQVPEVAAETLIDTFFEIDIRVGRVVAAVLNPKARKPSYRMEIDFGPLGMRTSSAQLTALYTPEELIGQQVLAVVNFPPRRVAGV